jgi:hypothetical protein
VVGLLPAADHTGRAVAVWSLPSNRSIAPSYPKLRRPRYIPTYVVVGCRPRPFGAFALALATQVVPRSHDMISVVVEFSPRSVKDSVTFGLVTCAGG